MLLFYNLAQIALLLTLFPLILFYVAIKKKYRDHLPRRLGKGLSQKLSSVSSSKKTVWIHALSVGEVTSAMQLVKRLDSNRKELNIVFSASTKTGLQLAEKKLADYCDAIIAFPLDLFPVVSYFINRIKPDVFVLVETDFWPNIMAALTRYNTPSLLVNCRISSKSHSQHKRFSPFFLPLFHSFEKICVQTDRDRSHLKALGIHAEKIVKLGNLKQEWIDESKADDVGYLLKEYTGFIFVAGSTHPGEEKILLDAYTSLHSDKPLLFVIAPRKIERTEEILTLVDQYDLHSQRYTSRGKVHADVLIVDTLGDLPSFYRHCHLSFVGGSLVEQGGHNPYEPARYGKPVLFGPYMTDFSEIADNLLACGGGFQVTNDKDISHFLFTFTSDNHAREKAGMSAKNHVESNGRLLEKHVDLIQKTLAM